MNPENIVVLPELKAYIDPLTPDEHDALERSILAEGCRDALVLWGDVLVDGHNRYGICQQHGLPFQTVQNTRFQSMEDVHLWMIDQHLGRRSVSEFQRGVLALKKREIIAERRAQAAAAVVAAKAEAAQSPGGQAPWEGDTDPVVAKALATVPKVPDDALDTREALARAARLSLRHPLRTLRAGPGAAVRLPRYLAPVRCRRVRPPARPAACPVQPDHRAPGQRLLHDRHRERGEHRHLARHDPAGGAGDGHPLG